MFALLRKDYVVSFVAGFAATAVGLVSTVPGLGL